MTMAVYYSELGVKDGSSPLTSYGWKGPGVGRKKIRVAWNNRFLAHKQLVGYSFAATVGGNKVLRRELPEMFNPSDTTLFCSSAEMSNGEVWQARNAWDRNTYAVLPGYPNNTRTKDADLYATDSAWKENIFKFANLNLTFQQADFYIRDDAYIDALGGNEIYRFVSYRDDRAASFITIPANLMYYVTETATVGNKDARLVPFGVGKLEAKKTIYLKWHQVALEAAPLATIDGMVGKVNSIAFAPPFSTVTYPAGSLLFNPPKIDRYIMANGGIGMDIELVLTYFPQLHNKILKAQTSSTENNRYLYVTSDPTIPFEPVPGTLTPDKFLFNETDFYQAFNCALP